MNIATMEKHELVRYLEKQARNPEIDPAVQKFIAIFRTATGAQILEKYGWPKARDMYIEALEKKNITVPEEAVPNPPTHKGERRMNMKRWYITREHGVDLAHTFGDFSLRDTDAACVVIEADGNTVQSCAFDEYPVPDSAYSNADNWDEWEADGGDYDRLVAEITEVFGPPAEEA